MYNWNYTDSIHLKEYQEYAEKDYFSAQILKPINLQDATILPYKAIDKSAHAGGGVIDSDGNYVVESAQHIVGKEMDQGYVVNASQRIAKKVMWFGAYHKHWGHFLTEMISRCWYIINHQPDDEDYYVAYCIKNDTTKEGMTGTYKEFMNLLGVKDERLILVDEPTSFTEVIIPPISCEAGKWYTKEYQEIFKYLIKVVEKASDKKNSNENVYLTRLGSRALSGTQIGEKQIQKIFRKNGYDIVSPELLSLKEQIQKYCFCKKMVVVEGTLMHNVLFCNENTELIIINRVVGINAYQPLINQAKIARVTYIDAHLSFFPVFAGGPFLFYLSENLMNFLKNAGFSYVGKRDGLIRLHLKLMWYFLYYIESMTGETIDNWNLVEQHKTGVLEQYRFYRYQLTDYNKNTVCRIRKALTLIMKGLFNL